MFEKVVPKIDRAFATRIKARRRAAGLTQCVLAIKLGVSQGAISKLERKAIPIHVVTVGRWCRVLRLTPEQLLAV